jgi:hypothetical protein
MERQYKWRKQACGFLSEIGKAGRRAKAGEIILRIADFISGALIGGGLGVSAVAVSAGVTGPEIGMDISTDLLNGRFWLPIRRFLDKVYDEFAKELKA